MRDRLTQMRGADEEDSEEDEESEEEEDDPDDDEEKAAPQGKLVMDQTLFELVRSAAGADDWEPAETAKLVTLIAHTARWKSEVNKR